jgi:integrase/recombinase XerD
MRSNSITDTPKPKPDLVTQFLKYLKVERGLTHNTLVSYGFDMKRLRAWTTKSKKTLLCLTHTDLRMWLQTLSRDDRFNPTSITRMISTLRQFFRWLKLDNYITQNPADGLYTPQRGSTLPRFLTIEEIDWLFSMPNIFTFEGIHDRALLEVLYGAGLRITEAVELKHSDIFNGRLIRVFGKGQKQRVTVMGRSAVTWLSRYAMLRANPDAARFVFVHPSQQINSKLICNILRRYAQTARIRNVSWLAVHNNLEARRAFAARLIEKGSQLFAESEIGLRDRAMVELMRAPGLRPSDLAR